MLTDSALMWTRIGAAVCAVIALSLLWNLYRARMRRAAARNWPAVPGDIIVSRIDRPAPHESGYTDCTPVIRFRYQVAGKTLEGDSVRPGGPSATSLVLAEQLVANYPAGSRVDVFYDPDDPSVAVLEPIDPGNVVALGVFATVFAVISGVLVAHAIAGKVLTTEGGVPLFGFLLPLAAIAVGIGGVVSFIRLRRQARASAAWPAAPGQITASSIVTEQVREQEDDRPDRFIDKYRPDIRYSYQVGDRHYHGNAVSFGWTALFGEPTEAQAVIAKYPLGADVQVFYDPDQPRNAVLEPQSRDGSSAPLLFGLFFGIGGALMLWAFTMIG